MPRLLRVLDVIRLCFTNFPIEILRLVNLRYLAVSCYHGVPVGISRLQNLHTLIVPADTDTVPLEIWELSELRHLKLSKRINIEDEQFTRIGERKLLKLQTICRVIPTPEQIKRVFFRSIPNIKKLTIRFGEYAEFSSVDLSHLRELETLTCEFDIFVSRSPLTLRFPTCLKRLTLSGYAATPNMLASLCGLPNLEVLSMKECQVGSKGDDGEWEWKVGEGDEFRSLQCLSLDDQDLVRWRAEVTNFPRLRQLRLSGCYKLEQIPSAIGEIPTLRLIQVDCCSNSVEASAKQIQQEQESEFGNYDIKFDIKIPPLWL